MSSQQQRLKQKSLLIDPSNILQFNVGNQNIHMKKIKSEPNYTNYSEESGGTKNLSPNSSIGHSQKFYYSIVEKQSQSGVSFNNRLFFLKDQDVFGYMSKTDLQFNVKKAKQAVPLKNLRKIEPKGKIMTLVFDFKPPNSKESDKFIQKTWILRMKDKKMADAWTDIINYQVAQIPSRKNTVVSPQQSLRSRQQSLKNKQQKKQQQDENKFIQGQEPIANERPEQDYLSVWKKSPQKRQVQLQNSKIQSPRSPRSNESDEKQMQGFSPQNFAARTYQKQEQHSTSEKHSQKKQRYLSTDTKFPYQSQFLISRQDGFSKQYIQQIEEVFRKQNQLIKQKFLFPNFINYFRPYIEDSSNTQDWQKIYQLDKKYQPFVTYCQITSKQLIDNQIPLNQFKLSNRFNGKNQNLSKERHLKQISQKYQNIFGKQPSKQMQIQAISLLFQHILYVQLEDIQIIIPLSELKTLPSSSDFANQNTSTNKICQNSLISEFQNKQKNLDFIYGQILKDEALKLNFYVPMRCEIEYKGFKLFFRTKVDEKMFNVSSLIQSKQNQNLSKSRLSKSRLSNASKTESVLPSFSSEVLHQKLAQSLFIQPQVVENHNLLKIKVLRQKDNQTVSTSFLDKRNLKYVIVNAEILPQINSNQVINSNIFINIHSSKLKLKNAPKNEVSQSSPIISIRTSLNNQSKKIAQQSESKGLQKKKQAGNKSIGYYNHQGSLKQNDQFLKLYREYINQKIKLFSQSLDRFEVPIIHPYELGQLLEHYQLNSLSLGKICQLIPGNNSYVRSIIKSQIAAECCRLILTKKIQQIMLSQKFNQLQNQQDKSQAVNKNITTLINLILGKSSSIKESELIWKVLTLHSQIIYSCSICQTDIHKGYFILSLVTKLNMAINPNSVSINSIFQTNKFITNIKFPCCKAKPSKISSLLFQKLQKLSFSQLQKNIEAYFQIILPIFCQNQGPTAIPYFIKKSKTLYNNILFILSQKISPNDIKYMPLNIYEDHSLNFTQFQASFELIQDQQAMYSISEIKKLKQLSSKRQQFDDNFLFYYQRKLKQLGYKTMQNISGAFNPQQQIQIFVKQIKVFYEFHPIISYFLDFLASYHTQKYQFQKALQCSKRSLSNMISLSEGNSNHCRLANCFYNIAMVYQKMRKFEDAINQLKRSKHCLEINKQENSVIYAKILIQIVKLNLANNGKAQDCFSNLISARNTLENESFILNNVEMLLQIYQLQNKCILSSKIDLSIIESIYKNNSEPFSQHYFSILEHLLKQQSLLMINNKKNSLNSLSILSLQSFQRFMKLILPHYFKQFQQISSQMFTSYLCEVSQSIAKKGGISYSKFQLEDQQNNQQQIRYSNTVKQFQNVFPNPKYAKKQKGSNVKGQQNYVNLIYNINDAFNHIKQRIYKGQFLVELIQYVEKSQQILNLIRDQIRLSKLNRSQSRSSSRMYLMSTKGHQTSEIKQQNQQSSIQLQNLLNSQQFIEMINQKQGFSLRQQRYDSLMRALLVLLGEGFMLHIFDECD